MNTATKIQTTVAMIGGAPAAPTIHDTTKPTISAMAQATSTPTHPLLAMFILYLRVDAVTMLFSFLVLLAPPELFARKPPGSPRGVSLGSGQPILSPCITA